MSKYQVTIETVKDVLPIENADRIELVKLADKDYQLVVQKNQFTIGSKIVYIPVDGIVPDKMLEQLGLTGRLAGGAKNRVKTIKLKGMPSQGLGFKPGQVEGSEGFDLLEPGTDVTEILGITKYDPEDQLQNPAGYKVRVITNPLPEFVKYYDIEGAQNHKYIVEKLMDVEVDITEKMEGSHFVASLDTNGEFTLCSRQRNLVDKENGDGVRHDWFAVAEKYDLKNKMNNHLNWLHDEFNSFRLTVRGEVCGPKWQGNYYGLKELELFIFEVEIDGEPIPAGAVYSTVKEHIGLKHVPFLFRGYLRDFIGGSSLVERSHGQSEVNKNKIREGIVIRPTWKEMRDDKLGRVIIKQRDPIYLSNEK